jgi:predicted XRE-type DNA-binding protein
MEKFNNQPDSTIKPGPTIAISPELSSVTGDAIKYLSSVQTISSFVQARERFMRAGAITLEDANNAGKEQALSLLESLARKGNYGSLKQQIEEWTKAGVLNQEEVETLLRPIAREQLKEIASKNIRSFQRDKEFWDTVGIHFEGV